MKPSRPITATQWAHKMRDTAQYTLPTKDGKFQPWFDMAKNYAMFANEGGTYDDLLDYIKGHGH